MVAPVAALVVVQHLGGVVVVRLTGGWEDIRPKFNFSCSFSLQQIFGMFVYKFFDRLDWFGSYLLPIKQVTKEENKEQDMKFNEPKQARSSIFKVDLWPASRQL